MDEELRMLEELTRIIKESAAETQKMLEMIRLLSGQ